MGNIWEATIKNPQTVLDLGRRLGEIVDQEAACQRMSGCVRHHEETAALRRLKDALWTDLLGYGWVSVEVSFHGGPVEECVLAPHLADELGLSAGDRVSRREDHVRLWQAYWTTSNGGQLLCFGREFSTELYPVGYDERPQFLEEIPQKLVGGKYGRKLRRAFPEMCQ